jgi:hypothetical protein
MASTAFCRPECHGVPKQSFETRRPLLPSVAYFMVFSFLVSPKFAWREGVSHWHGRLSSLEP